MSTTRRRVLGGMAAAALAGVSRVPRAHGQGMLPPIIFVHGNGDHAALWMTTLWRFEANGFPRERLTAFNFTDPLSRNDDAVAMAGRSGSEDQLRELVAVIAAVKARTGAPRVALVGSSRGGYAIRNAVVEAGHAAEVSHAVLCGTPNYGVFDWEANPGSEFNGRGPFLKRLNGHASDVVPDTAFLTLRSDGYDKYAQADGRILGRPGVDTGVTPDGPALRGATNLVIGHLDHREVAFHPRAFREIYRFIAAEEPRVIAVAPQARVTLDGLVTGNPGGVPNNRPVAGATIEVYRVDPVKGERQGQALLRRTTGPDGRWGPVTVAPTDWLEFMVTAPNQATTHIYRSPFLRSSDVVHLRPARPLAEADKAAGAIVQMVRPRGYFGLPRDIVLFDGKEPSDIARGVPTDSATMVKLPIGEIGRPVVGMFNQERIVARAWPAAENRLTVAELTW